MIKTLKNDGCVAPPQSVHCVISITCKKPNEN